MASQTQTFANHRRYHAIWHFFAFPVLMLNVFFAIRSAVRLQTLWSVWDVVVAAAILVAVFAARVQTVTVQNRVIRLEMQARLRGTLPATMHGRIADLSLKQLIGLRFAGDAELPALVDRCLTGELKNDEAVKKQVRDWQADFVRA